MAAQSQNTNTMYQNYANTQSFVSVDTLQAEKEDAQMTTKKSRKGFRLFSSRSSKPRASEKAQQQQQQQQPQTFQSTQEVVDEIYRRYPLAAFNSTPAMRQGYI